MPLTASRYSGRYYYTTISYLTVQQSKLSPQRCCGRRDALLPEAEGNSALGHLQHRGDGSFDCCIKRYEIVVLLPNSDHTACTDPTQL